MSGGVLDPQGPIGAAEKTILLNSLAIMLAIVIPTIVATLGTAWWFRSTNRRAKYRPDWVFAGQIELVVWAIPAMVVVLVGGIAWIGSHELDPQRPLASSVKPLRVEVIAFDWNWLFIYPDLGVASMNRLAIPIATPIEFRLTSATVMNSFFVPQLGSQIYAMGGMVTRLSLQADHRGQFKGFSAQLSGRDFSDMNFTVDALDGSSFDAWVGTARRVETPLDWRGFAALAAERAHLPATPAHLPLAHERVSSPWSGATSYGTVSPGLFDEVVHRTAGAQTSRAEPHGRAM